MWPDLCHAGLVVALEHQAWPADPCSLQHFIGLFAGVVELSATLNRAAQEVVHAHPRQADCVFQDFDAFFGVEGPHLLRYVQKCTNWRKWQKWLLIAKIAKL